MATQPGGARLGAAGAGLGRGGTVGVAGRAIVVAPAEGADEGEGGGVVRGHEDARGCCWGHAPVIDRRQEIFTALKGAGGAPTT